MIRASIMRAKLHRHASPAAITCALIFCVIIAIGSFTATHYWAADGMGRLAGAHSDRGHLSTTHAPGASARPVVTVVSSEFLPHIPGKKITTVLLDFPPGAVAPEHHHSGSVSVYVVSGSIRSQLKGSPVGTFKAGEMFFEPPGITHVFAENVSKSEPARVLAVFVHDEGAPLTTYH